jgi:hypothetical protein
MRLDHRYKTFKGVKALKPDIVNIIRSAFPAVTEDASAFLKVAVRRNKVTGRYRVLMQNEVGDEILKWEFSTEKEANACHQWLYGLFLEEVGAANCRSAVCEDRMSKSKSCGNCRYWSEMVAGTNEEGSFGAVCLNDDGPWSGGFTAEEQSCAQWAHNTWGRI